MTEITQSYTHSGQPLTLEALKQKPCCLPFANENYAPPTASEVRALIALTGWSQNDVAKITGVSFDPKKGSPTVRRWKAKEGDKHLRTIPYAAWRLLLLTANCARDR